MSVRRLKVFLDAVGLDAAGVRLKDFLGLEAVGKTPMAFLVLVTDEISDLDKTAV